MKKTIEIQNPSVGRMFLACEVQNSTAQPLTRLVRCLKTRFFIAEYSVDFCYCSFIRKHRQKLQQLTQEQLSTSQQPFYQNLWVFFPSSIDMYRRMTRTFDDMATSSSHFAISHFHLQQIASQVVISCAWRAYRVRKQSKIAGQRRNLLRNRAILCLQRYLFFCASSLAVAVIILVFDALLDGGVSK